MQIRIIGTTRPYRNICAKQQQTQQGQCNICPPQARREEKHICNTMGIFLHYLMSFKLKIYYSSFIVAKVLNLPLSYL